MTNFTRPPVGRPCPNVAYCKRQRRAGEIFCHSCYFRLPKELRQRLWARDFSALAQTIKDCKAFLKDQQKESE